MTRWDGSLLLSTPIYHRHAQSLWVVLIIETFRSGCNVETKQNERKIRKKKKRRKKEKWKKERRGSSRGSGEKLAAPRFDSIPHLLVVGGGRRAGNLAAEMKHINHQVIPFPSTLHSARTTTPSLAIIKRNHKMY